MRTTSHASDLLNMIFDKRGKNRKTLLQKVMQHLTTFNKKTNCCDVWTDGWMDGCTDGRMDGQIDEHWTDGWTNR